MVLEDRELGWVAELSGYGEVVVTRSRRKRRAALSRKA
jgi:hypothetical protein